MSDTIYIAGSSREIPLIQGFLKSVEAYGYHVTHDWTTHFGFDVPDPGPTDEELTQAARDDLTAVREADILWYCAPASESGKSEGSHAELLAAIVLGKVVVVSGDLGRHRIFPRLALHRFALHAEALEFLRTRAWDTCEYDLLRMLMTADSVTIPPNHLGLQRAAEALHKEGRVRATIKAGSTIVTRKDVP